MIIYCLYYPCLSCRVELSSDQVVKPVNTEALSKWVGKIPADVVNDMASLAPMLSRLGYDPLANPPNYSKPDLLFLNNTKIARSIQNWKVLSTCKNFEAINNVHFLST